MRLEVSRDVLTGIRAEIAAAHPLEACGLLFGDESRISGWRLAPNVAKHPEGEFEIDAATLFAALRAERAGGARLTGYWHSHPTGEAQPSSHDVEAMQADGKIWVIVAGDDIMAWRIAVTDEFVVDGVWQDSLMMSVRQYLGSDGVTKDIERIALMTGEARHLLPQDKLDVYLVSMIAEVGYPAIAPILDDLMEWTADPNWPICGPLTDYLVTLGEPMVEPIRRVLRGTDDAHKWVCLRGMVPELPPGVQALLRDDLQRLAKQSCDGGGWGYLDIEARKILTALA
jgi:proteasome lid subunit RPN8/RPN11